MKFKNHNFYLTIVSFCTAILFCAFVNVSPPGGEKINMPYKKLGLTNAQAAAHLLSRFTYGAKPGQVQEVTKKGLEKWLQEQLDGKLSDEYLTKKLSSFDAINLTNTEVEDIFPRQPTIRRIAINEGFLHKDSISDLNKKYERTMMEAYMKQKGYRPQQELFRQFFSQKMLRAAYTNNQLTEILTDFWFNHFNVAINKPQCASFIPAYERDVIRPNVLGNFGELLLQTAKSPAMSLYLDNFTSSGVNISSADQSLMMNQNFAMMNDAQKKRVQERIKKINQQMQQRANQGGLNENYAREVMELHTMGVDGGYTQSDVTQAAKILTGWTIAPIGKIGYGVNNRKLLERLDNTKLEDRGFVIDGDFLFAANKHDNGEKVVLGKKFPAGGGYQEGVDLLAMLASHQATAKFISKKIATRFVNDNPASTLVDKMAKVFLSSKGNIRSVIVEMVNAPEFWSKEALREKTKSPFEFAISAVRSLDAQIERPYELYTWITKMGQQMYYYQAPTGFPDNGQYWINTGALLSRMNFGLALAAQRINGIKFNLSALNDHKEPESLEAALATYSELLMPERDITTTVARLKPMLNDNNLAQKVEKAVQKQMSTNNEMAALREDNMPIDNQINKKDTQQNLSGNVMLAQVVGVIIGSPEFQRK